MKLIKMDGVLLAIIVGIVIVLIIKSKWLNNSLKRQIGFI